MTLNVKKFKDLLQKEDEYKKKIKEIESTQTFNLKSKEAIKILKMKFVK